MISLAHRGLPLCDGLSRREWLRIGGTTLAGLSLPQLLQARQRPASGDRSFGRAKACIVFGLVGGPPQHETWDPKPDAAAEVRGTFGTIPTSVPGYRVGELMPKTARLVDRCAVLRAMFTGDNAHSSSGYYMFTGVPHQPMNFENATPKAPNDSPTLGAYVMKVRPSGGPLPAAVRLPINLANTSGAVWPGQDAGWLGRAADPWLMTCDPSEPNFKVESLHLPDDTTPDRVDSRRRLLEQVNHALDSVARTSHFSGFNTQTQQAFDLLRSPMARTAFDLNREPDAIRDRYTRTRWGQSCLLARRLVEAGVSLVHVNWTGVKDKPNSGGWDTHDKHFECLKEFLMPMMDASFSALLEDLEVRGLLDETLVVWWGEFGRTPRINGRAGRDHWGPVFSLALAGGGVRGGTVHGSTDAVAAYPRDGMVKPEDLNATILHCLGIDPETEFRDPLGRPMPASRGRVVREILA